MALYSYTAKNTIGGTTKGVVDAPDEESAKNLLRERQLIVLTLKTKSRHNPYELLMNAMNKVKVKEVTFFARQLSVLINATIPVVRALKVLVKQTENKVFKEIISDVASEVDGGAKLSQAMARYPHVFDGFFVHMVRAGETTGRLDQVLNYLADQKEKDYALRSQITGAMMYPGFIMMAMIGIGVVMLIWVVPKLAGIITQGGGELPFATAVLLGLSSFFVGYWWLIILLVGIIGGGVYFFARTAQGKYYIDVLKLKLPVIGPLFQKVALARFAVSFSNLLSSGVPVTKSLGIAGDVIGNAVYQDIIKRTIVEVEGGNSISTIFATSKYAPPIVAQMISVGEETGKLDQILGKLADFYSKEVENSVATLTSLMEPMIIVTLGLGAAFMVYAILMPMYNITDSIG
ncbi:MAG: type II secretion system F family protein [bacterium]|nr:type II secretion system F family protein [bacterium]